FVRVKANATDVEEAGAPRNEVNRLAIGRPTRLVIPIFPVRDPRPVGPKALFASTGSGTGEVRRRHYTDGRYPVIAGLPRHKANPALIGRELGLPEVVLGVLGHHASFGFRGGGRGDRPQANRLAVACAAIR